MRKKHIQYGEGQWFAVPLRIGGYAIGIIVRGSYKTKGGLGYFFGPRYRDLPDEHIISDKTPDEAILITRFGDLGIVNGRWPLLNCNQPFSKEEWPIPRFGLEISLLLGKGFIRDNGQNDAGELILLKETLVDAKDLAGLPEDVAMGGGAVEIRLTNLLNDS